MSRLYYSPDRSLPSLAAPPHDYTLRTLDDPARAGDPVRAGDSLAARFLPKPLLCARSTRA